MTMSETAISFQHVYKRFPGMENYAVEDVSLDIHDGEFVTILGTSGSGKTTMMKMVNQLYSITSGDIIFCGQSIRKLDPVEQRRKIGYVVQAGGLFPHMTVEDNIAVVPNILKWDAARISSRVDELLRMVNLDPATYRKRFPRQLSGGQQQRVGIARAMAADPSIMLMDEPFGAIDAITRNTLQQEVLRLQKQTGKTILFVTHDIEEAFLLGTRVIIMDAGKLQQFDTPDQIMMHPANDFVRKFVAADDPITRMKRIHVSAVMKETDTMPSGAAVVASDASLEDRMILFLEDRGRTVYVKDDRNDQIRGKVTWNDLAALAGEETR